jgi:hypothetical protein
MDDTTLSRLDKFKSFNFRVDRSITKIDSPFLEENKLVLLNLAKLSRQLSFIRQTLLLFESFPKNTPIESEIFNTSNGFCGFLQGNFKVKEVYWTVGCNLSEKQKQKQLRCWICDHGHVTENGVGIGATGKLLFDITIPEYEKAVFGADNMFIITIVGLGYKEVKSSEKLITVYKKSSELSCK